MNTDTNMYKTILLCQKANMQLCEYQLTTKAVFFFECWHTAKIQQDARNQIIYTRTTMKTSDHTKDKSV